MRRIIITAILTVICAVGACTSFAVNDLPNFGEWMKTNEQQFRRSPKPDAPHKHRDKPMMDDRNQKGPQDGMPPKENQGQGPQNGPQGQPNPPQGPVAPPQGQPNAPQGSMNGNQPDGVVPPQASNTQQGSAQPNTQAQ